MKIPIITPAGAVLLALSSACSIVATHHAADVDGDASPRTTGDFDGDGRLDRAIGFPDENVLSIGDGRHGFVEIRYGAPPGSAGGSAQYLLASDDLQPDQHLRFGQALLVVDFDEDGFDDLAVGAPGLGGGFFVFRGGLEGLDPLPSLYTPEDAG